MIKVHYPEDIDKLKQSYLGIFDIDTLKTQWASYKSIINVEVEELLTGDFEKLVDVYLSYIEKNPSTDTKKSHKGIFDYKKWQPAIAKFFMDINNGFDISTCHYCNMAYINCYGKYSSQYNHFDLDHLLPKSICPILGLSLFNLVPSCQVCNERLKKAKELAVTKEDWLKISPTYMESTFDEDVTIKLRLLEKCSTFFELMENEGNYRLEFDTKGLDVYDKYISIFKLQDRYNYHKIIALHILDLKERYPEEKRKEISRLLSTGASGSGDMKYSISQIKEDVFHEDLNRDRCFSKLMRDMLDKN